MNDICTQKEGMFEMLCTKCCFRNPNMLSNPIMQEKQTLLLYPKRKTLLVWKVFD